MMNTASRPLDGHSDTSPLDLRVPTISITHAVVDGSLREWKETQAKRRRFMVLLMARSLTPATIQSAEESRIIEAHESQGVRYYMAEMMAEDACEIDPAHMAACARLDALPEECRKDGLPEYEEILAAQEEAFEQVLQRAQSYFGCKPLPEGWSSSMFCMGVVRMITGEVSA